MLDVLLDVLNNTNPSIQFTMERSDAQLAFLDVLINKDEINFSECLFKTKGFKRYVSFKLNHPKHSLEKYPIYPHSLEITL